MEHKTLTASVRTELGKGAAGRIRREGLIPAVIYGSKKSLNITINARDFHSKFKTISENTIIDIQLDGKEHQVLVKDYQSDILTGSIDHLDFYEIAKGKTLKTHVPIKLEGNPPGVKEGGIMVQKQEELEVECLPKDMPEFITVDISSLNLGDSIHVSDIVVDKKVKLLDHKDGTIVVVNAPKAAAVSVEEESEEGESEVEEA